MVVNVNAQRLQMDEIWGFVGSKERNTSEAKKAEGAGDAWIWSCIDQDSKLVVSWVVGIRGASEASWLVHDVRTRVHGRVQVTTDNLTKYRIPMQEAFGQDVDYARIRKVFGKDYDSPAGRYSPPKCVGCRRERVRGNPNRKHITTSHIERSHLTTRMNVRRMTRLTNAFSKKVENLRHAMALHFVYYNFCRVHMTLKTTPAIRAGVADRQWEIGDLIGLLDQPSN